MTLLDGYFIALGVVASTAFFAASYYDDIVQEGGDGAPLLREEGGLPRMAVAGTARSSEPSHLRDGGRFFVISKTAVRSPSTPVSLDPNFDSVADDRIRYDRTTIDEYTVFQEDEVELRLARVEPPSPTPEGLGLDVETIGRDEVVRFDAPGPDAEDMYVEGVARVVQYADDFASTRTARTRLNLPLFGCLDVDGGEWEPAIALRAIARAVHQIRPRNVVPTVHVGQDLDWTQLRPHVTAFVDASYIAPPHDALVKKKKAEVAEVGGQVGGALGAMLGALGKKAAKSVGEMAKKEALKQAKELKTEALKQAKELKTEALRTAKGVAKDALERVQKSGKDAGVSPRAAGTSDVENGSRGSPAGDADSSSEGESDAPGTQPARRRPSTPRARGAVEESDIGDSSSEGESGAPGTPPARRRPSTPRARRAVEESDIGSSSAEDDSGDDRTGREPEGVPGLSNGTPLLEPAKKVARALLAAGTNSLPGVCSKLCISALAASGVGAAPEAAYRTFIALAELRSGGVDPQRVYMKLDRGGNMMYSAAPRSDAQALYVVEQMNTVGDVDRLTFVIGADDDTAAYELSGVKAALRRIRIETQEVAVRA
jgi:hypothetical protein